MTQKELKKIYKILNRAYAELELEALKEGVSITSVEYDLMVDKAREAILKKFGYTPEEYRAAKAEAEVVRRGERPSFEELKSTLEEVKKVWVTKEEAVEIAHAVAKKYITAPQVINKIVKEIKLESPPQIIKETMHTTERVEYDPSPIMAEIGSLNDRLERITVTEPPDLKTFREELRKEWSTDFGKNFEHNINTYGMPDFRKLAMGLQGQIDELRIAEAPSSDQTFHNITVTNLLSTKEIAVTQEQVSGNIRPGYQAFYNGGAAGNAYSIGQAFSIDGVDWIADGNNPFLAPVPATWEANVVKDPWVVVVNNIIYLYYAGWRSSTDRFQIGLAISKDYGRTFTKYSGNPIIANGTAGSVDERRAMFPTVVYEADEVNPAKRWKMWYAGRNSSDVENLAYATSADGITWTKFGQVLTVGTIGQFDDTVLQTGDVKKVGSTYYLFYGAATTVAGRYSFSTGLATFTNPEGTYTKQGQILTGLPTKVQNLTANTLSASAVVTVADTSVFEANEYVYIADSDSTPMLSRIASIDSATQITLRDVANANFTTANSAALRSAYSWSVAPRSIFRENGHWTMAVTLYQVFGDLPAIGPNAYLNEVSGWAYNYNENPTGAWTFDIKRGVAVEPLAGTWATVSAENFAIIPLRFASASHLFQTGNGDVSGPSSSTDNALARFDGATGKLIQNSLGTIDDVGVLTVPSAIINTDASASTNTQPLFYIGATPYSGWAALSAGGTYWGVNALTAFTGNFLAFLLNGSTKFTVTSGGTIFTPNGMANASSLGNAYVNVAAAGTIISRNVADANPAVILQQTHASSTGDIAQFKSSAGVLASISQTGKFVLSGAAATLRLKGYAVASLPVGVLGDIAFVTDQLTAVAAKGVAPTGGGAVNCVVFYNGAAWVGI